MINLVTVCGHNTTMLRHMLKHYRDFVDEIYVVVYLSSDKDRVLSEVKEITRDLNIDIHKQTIEEPFNWERVTELYNETKLLKPDDWWIVADDDEFHLYPKPISELIEDCEGNGYKFITGAFLDRIGEGGKFPLINDDSDIWKEFPLVGSFRYPVSNACPNKTIVMKGDIQVTNGQHYAMVNGKDTYGDRWMNDLRYPTDDCFIQVHHFKWDVSVISRLKDVSRKKESYTFHEEYKKMFDYILDNFGTIDITDKRFMIERCGKNFYDYTKWDSVKMEALEYRV
jgi:hypothetical protein|tara:strand:+ start:6277 stop:7125 length:849 start_codon:yes stop_codon:yes gene_type:complete